MACHPAKEVGRDGISQSPFWLQIQSIYEQTLPLELEARGDWHYLSAHYILERRGHNQSDLQDARSALVAPLRQLSIRARPGGAAENFPSEILHEDRQRRSAL